MSRNALPKSLITPDALDDLIFILLEKEKLRRTLDAKKFGDRVADEDKARQLIERVSQSTRNVLGLKDLKLADPELVLTQRLKKLPFKTFILSLIFVPLGFSLLYATFLQADGGMAVWVVRAAILFLLLFPFILHRRMRLNIEHECNYARDGRGQAVIIDQLRAVQFESYLVHEYAHHLFFYYFDEGNEEWTREGWARFVQWQVCNYWYRAENNPAYLYHALVQIIGELKFACILISMALRLRLPRKARQISTPYKSNLLSSFFTGTPQIDVNSLINHSIGTAFFFLKEKRKGLDEALWNIPGEKEKMES